MSNSSRVDGPFTEKALVAAIILCLGLQAWLALVTELNWDEFFYLSQIYSYQRGELASPLQTFHVHLLGWLTSVPGNEVDQVVAGRLAMLACEAGSCAFIYLLSRSFASRVAALVAVLGFVSSVYTMLYGASFRADPLAAVFMMAALVIVARARPGLLWAAAAALAAALAAMVTVKVVLYAPAFLGVAAWRIATAADRKRTLWWLAGAGAAAVAACAILYAVQLGLMAHATNAAAQAGLGNAAQTQTGAGLLPRLYQIRIFIEFSPMQVLLLAVGGIVGVAMLLRGGSRAAGVAVLGCGATLLCLLFYRNAFPYFFPFILAPAAVLIALAIDRVRLLSRFALLLALGLVAPAIAVAPAWSARGQQVQRQVVDTVHRMFLRPVAYIDRNSMIASFPKRGFFMSTWGMTGYLKGPPVFARVLASETVPLLIVNGPALEGATGTIRDVPEQLRLLPEDEAVIRDNFLPYWGRIWLAGKRIEATQAGATVTISVPGIYTVEGGPATIDGKAVTPGATVRLARRSHFVRAPFGVTLRWGDHLYRPSEAPSSAPIYRGS